MKFESDVFQIWLSTTINTRNAIVMFVSSVKLDTFAKSPDILRCHILVWVYKVTWSLIRAHNWLEEFCCRPFCPCSLRTAGKPSISLRSERVSVLRFNNTLLWYAWVSRQLLLTSVTLGHNFKARIIVTAWNSAVRTWLVSCNFGLHLDRTFTWRCRESRRLHWDVPLPIRVGWMFFHSYSCFQIVRYWCWMFQ